MKSALKTPEKKIPPSATGRCLVAYFSWSGNTREVANQIHGIVGGHLYEIVSVNKYPSDYNDCVDQAKRELDELQTPDLKSEVQNIDTYDVVFIGYPNWWGTIPRPVATFLLKCDSSGKSIAPFCTHGGDRLGRSVEDIAEMCPRSKVLEGLAIQGGSARTSQDAVSEWLRRIGATDR
jgi:flavodoxin